MKNTVLRKSSAAMAALALASVMTCLCADSLGAATVYVSPEGRTPEERW